MAAEAEARPELLPWLAEGLRSADPVVAMRAADALEKATRQYPGRLQPFAGDLLEMAAQAKRKEIRWHMAQLLPRIRWDADQLTRVEAVLAAWLEDSSRIVVTFALQGLADLAHEHPHMREALALRLEAFCASPHGSIRSRALRLRSQMARQGHSNQSMGD